VFTPIHASWLNAIENFFSKITRNLLGTIRVESLDELSKRIDLYIGQLNEEPTKPSWKYRIEKKKRFLVGLVMKLCHQYGIDVLACRPYPFELQPLRSWNEIT